MINKLAVVTVLVMVATLSVAGCTVGLPITSSPTPTPTPTAAPTPPVDYSSYFDKAYEGGNSIMVQPFTKSTNERGNDVYKGVARNATLPGSSTVTMVIELTKSEAEAKQLHDSQVSGKLSEGYTPDATTAAKYHANYPDTVAVWVGTYGANVFVCYYQHDYTVNGWQSIQQSFSLAQ